MSDSQQTHDKHRGVDNYVARKLSARRKALGLRQKDLAEIAGVSSQQIVKYENGKNRMGASILHALSSMLEVPISYFFPAGDESLDNEEEAASNQPMSGSNNSPREIVTEEELVFLVRSLRDIKSSLLRKKFLRLARDLADLAVYTTLNKQ